VRVADVGSEEFQDWAVGRGVHTNPAGSVRGPQHIVKGGKTPALDPTEARALLDSIDTTTPAGLRDQALIALTVYSFGGRLTRASASNTSCALRKPSRASRVPKPSSRRHTVAGPFLDGVAGHPTGRRAG
jgi:site-specific recombinase XerC